MTHTKEMQELLDSINEFLQTNSLLTTSDTEVMRFAERVTQIAGSLDVYKYNNYDGFDHYIRHFQDKAANDIVDVEAALRVLRITKERIGFHLHLETSDTRQG